VVGVLGGSCSVMLISLPLNYRKTPLNQGLQAPVANRLIDIFDQYRSCPCIFQ
jgi:hypothetical protein